MNFVEFQNKCDECNCLYKDLFGYEPYRYDYIGNQEEYLDALEQAIETKRDITNFIPKNSIYLIGAHKRYRGPGWVHEVKFVLTKLNFYETTINGVDVSINKDNFNDETLVYAYKMVKTYIDKKDEIIDALVKNIIDSFCEASLWSVEDIKERLNEPVIEITDVNCSSLVWLKHQLGEWVIEEDMATLWVAVKN